MTQFNSTVISISYEPYKPKCQLIQASYLYDLMHPVIQIACSLLFEFSMNIRVHIYRKNRLNYFFPVSLLKGWLNYFFQVSILKWWQTWNIRFLTFGFNNFFHATDLVSFCYVFVLSALSYQSYLVHPVQSHRTPFWFGAWTTPLYHVCHST